MLESIFIGSPARLRSGDPMNIDSNIIYGAGAALLGLLYLLYRRTPAVVRSGPDWSKVSLVVDKSDYSILLAGPDGRVEWVNPAFARMSGYEAREVIGKALGGVLLGQLQSPKAAQQIKSGFTSRKAFSLEILCAHKNGHRYWLELTLTPIFDAGEHHVTFLGLRTASTVRRRPEGEAARANRCYEMFLNSAAEGIIGLDLQGSITFANPAAARMTGWEPGDLIGKPASLILHQLRV